MRLRLFGLALVFAAACGDDGPDGTPKDAPVVDAAVDGAGPLIDASCFENPQNNDEIINACTTAQKIYKDSTPPLLLPDGGLPALPP